MRNLKEFKELILKYESITLGDLEKSKKQMELRPESDYELNKEEIPEILENITNFGTKFCTLCIGIGMDSVSDIYNCQECTWVKLTNYTCFGGSNKETYTSIDYSTSVLDLKESINKRAKYMRKVLKEKNIEI